MEVRPIKGQIDDLISEINLRVERNERVFITTLTKKMSEDLTDYLEEVGIKVKYLHSDIKITWNVRKSSVTYDSGNSMCWSESTCFVKG